MAGRSIVRKTSGTIHSRGVPAVWSVVPVTGLPAPPSAVHQPQSRPGTWSSNVATTSTAMSTSGAGQMCRQRMPRTIGAVVLRPAEVKE